MPRRKAAGDVSQEPKTISPSVWLSAMPVPFTPELKPKRPSTSRKMKTTNVVGENKDAGTITILETKPEEVKEECNMESAENGDAKTIAAPTAKAEAEEAKEQINEDTEEHGGEKKEAVAAEGKDDELEASIRDAEEDDGGKEDSGEEGDGKTEEGLRNQVQPTAEMQRRPKMMKRKETTKKKKMAKKTEMGRRKKRKMTKRGKLKHRETQKNRTRKPRRITGNARGGG